MPPGIDIIIGNPAGGTSVEGSINDAPTKETPVDADVVGYIDTENGDGLVKTTWLKIKGFFQTSFSVIYILKSIFTTKGDLLTYSDAITRLGVGADGTILKADSAEVTGLKWVDLSAVGSVYATKSSSVDAGTKGDKSYDDNYSYTCTKTGTAGNAIWKKSALLNT